MAELSPMMKQYLRIKSQNEDSILFFRVGDFYEMFFDDAKKASDELDLTLTGKDCGMGERAPMCGVPYHSCESYIARLVQKGYKVAICEQTEDPKTAKKLVDRDIIRVITPGTVIEDMMLEEGKNNYLAAVALTGDGVGLCFTDASTGECHLTSFPADNYNSAVSDELLRFAPREILVAESLKAKSAALWDFLQENFKAGITVRNEEAFEPQKTEELFVKHFGISELEERGIDKTSSKAAALGAVIDYLYETGRTGSISVNKIDVYTDSQFMRLDMTALRNLELTETMRTKSKRATAHRFPEIKNMLSSAKCLMLKEIHDCIDTVEETVSLIDEAIDPDSPVSVREGGIIKGGYNEEVDIIRGDMSSGNNFLTDIENREKERTGIKNLKVRFNKVFGYYIEVTNSFLDKVPPDYIRKQTLTNCERFITEELKEIERRVLSAKDRIEQLEFELFDGIRDRVAAELKRFQATASALATLDTLCSLAEVAVGNRYCRPLVNNGGSIAIKAGRHPVVEQVINTPFVANDTFLNMKDNRCAIITGPNMAGKSTYMRQTAIIVLMAQMGSFVPAESAEIGLCDAIFTRVGASDDLAAGQSTFMVEMSEVAEILKNATKHSLLILDEIGRGTSTFDGMSIARAVLEYVADKKTLGAKALFSTHYHELTSMENELQGVKNYNVAVKKRGDDITFLRRIIPGEADGSYGIEVAKLSGIPESVIRRAKQILKKTEEEGVVTYRTVENPDMQLPLEMQGAQDILHELQTVDVNTLTPIEAMQTLFEMVTKAKSV